MTFRGRIPLAGIVLASRSAIKKPQAVAGAEYPT